MSGTRSFTERVSFILISQENIMARIIEIKSQDNHLDSLKLQRSTHIEAYGSNKNAAGHTAPRTPNASVKQLAGWWYKEYTKALLAKPWLRDPAQKTWEKDAQKVIKDTKDADPDAEYVDNHWFWNIALTKLAIFLESQKLKASPMHLFVEALGESASERIDDAREFIENASEVASDTISAVSKVANAVSDASEAAWSGVKTVAIVGGSLVGAAIILPPIIRAVRE